MRLASDGTLLTACVCCLVLLQQVGELSAGQQRVGDTESAVDRFRRQVRTRSRASANSMASSSSSTSSGSPAALQRQTTEEPTEAQLQNGSSSQERPGSSSRPSVSTASIKPTTSLAAEEDIEDKAPPARAPAKAKRPASRRPQVDRNQDGDRSSSLDGDDEDCYDGDGDYPDYRQFFNNPMRHFSRMMNSAFDRMQDNFGK